MNHFRITVNHLAIAFEVYAVTGGHDDGFVEFFEFVFVTHVEILKCSVQCPVLVPPLPTRIDAMRIPAPGVDSFSASCHDANVPQNGDH